MGKINQSQVLHEQQQDGHVHPQILWDRLDSSQDGEAPAEHRRKNYLETLSLTLPTVP